MVEIPTLRKKKKRQEKAIGGGEERSTKANIRWRKDLRRRRIAATNQRTTGSGEEMSITLVEIEKCPLSYPTKKLITANSSQKKKKNFALPPTDNCIIRNT